MLLPTLLLQLISFTLFACQTTMPDVTNRLSAVPAIQVLTTATPTPAIATILTATLDLAPFTITLPAPWLVYHPQAAEWPDQVQQFQADHPNLEQYFQVLATAAPTTTLALAWPAASHPDVTLFAAVTPAADLTLQTYLIVTAEELTQSRLTVGSRIKIQSATIRYDLHHAHVPVAVLQYTLPGSGPEDDPTQLITGYQAALLDTSGTQLLLLTFTSQAADAEQMLALVEAIIAAIDVM